MTSSRIIFAQPLVWTDLGTDNRNRQVTRPTNCKKNGGGGSSNDATEDWVEATSEFFRDDVEARRPIMLFDGVCNLCNGGVRFVMNNDSSKRMRFVPLQSESGKNLLRRSGRSPEDISSVVLVEKNRSYIKSEAVVKIMEYMDLPFPQLAVFIVFIPM